MRTFIFAIMFCLTAAAAQAGLSTGPQQLASVRNAKAQTEPTVKPADPTLKPVQPVRKKQKRRREEDDDEIRIDIDID